jgi:hypothetical protein
LSQGLDTATGQDLLERDPTDILYREIRREGRVVAVLRGTAAGGEVTVQTRVFPQGHAPGDRFSVDRPFTFTTADRAHAFVDEATVAFEYLGCAVS